MNKIEGSGDYVLDQINKMPPEQRAYAMEVFKFTDDLIDFMLDRLKSVSAQLARHDCVKSGIQSIIGTHLNIMTEAAIERFGILGKHYEQHIVKEMTEIFNDALESFRMKCVVTIIEKYD